LGRGGSGGGGAVSGRVGAAATDRRSRAAAGGAKPCPRFAWVCPRLLEGPVPPGDAARRGMGAAGGGRRRGGALSRSGVETQPLHRDAWGRRGAGLFRRGRASRPLRDDADSGHEEAWAPDSEQVAGVSSPPRCRGANPENIGFIGPRGIPLAADGACSGGGGRFNGGTQGGTLGPAAQFEWGPFKGNPRGTAGVENPQPQPSGGVLWGPHNGWLWGGAGGGRCEKKPSVPAGPARLNPSEGQRGLNRQGRGDRWRKPWRGNRQGTPPKGRSGGGQAA